MSRYLVIREGDRVHSRRMLGDWKQFDYVTIRRYLEELFPGRKVASPLEDLPPGGEVVAAYVSPNKYGEGRIDHNFQQWAIGPKLSDTL